MLKLLYMYTLLSSTREQKLQTKKKISCKMLLYNERYIVSTNAGLISTKESRVIQMWLLAASKNLHRFESHGF